MCQWFAILARPTFSIFDEIYAFVRDPTDTPVHVPVVVRRELLLFAAVAPLLSASLARRFSNILVATDAAPEFGFGVSVCHTFSSLVRTLSRKAESRGDFVRLDRNRDPDPVEARPRLGAPIILPVGKRDFHPVVSSPARFHEHSGSLELKAVLLALRWMAAGKHFLMKRVVILIDAKAVLSSCQKGRSSSWSFKRSLRRIAAYLLGLGLLAKFLYVPSEDNPADEPSRASPCLA